MHTEGRRVPNPGQGGAAPQTSISPSLHNSSSGSSSDGHLEPALPPTEPAEHRYPDAHSSSSIIKDFKQPTVRVSPLDPTMRFTPKGKLIPTRPARKVPVQLPSGFLEPSSYPPSSEYIESLAGQTPKRHPLWQFFRVPEAAMQPLTADAKAPVVDGGSLEPLAGDDSNLNSGA